MGELFIAFGILTAIIWIVIGWRAMRAHEKIADNILLYIDGLSQNVPNELRRENAIQHKHYKQFIMEHSYAENLPSKKRHEMFRDWLRSRKNFDQETS